MLGQGRSGGAADVPAAVVSGPYPLRDTSFTSLVGCPLWQLCQQQPLLQSVTPINGGGGGWYVVVGSVARDAAVANAVRVVVRR